MTRIHRQLLGVTLCLGLAIGATACGKKAAENTPEPSPVAAELAVVSVDLGRGIGGDKRVTDKTESFGKNDVIYASVVTTGSSPDAALKARWTYQDGQVVDESEQRIAPTGEAATEFHISKPDGWPVGKYKLEVFVNGISIQTKDFEVK